MTNKIFEYKDDNDWYVAGGAEMFHFATSGEAELVLDELCRLSPGENHEHPMPVGIIKYQSAFNLIRFYVSVLNELEDRTLEVKQHQGAVLVSEKDKLLLVHMPKQGVSLKDFFGEASSFGDTLLIATRNEGKTREFRRLFAELGIKVENLNDYPELPEVEETGMTFEENARLKAETIANMTGKMVLADDSGLKVDALGGLPGVWSARFSGPKATDESNNAKLLHELAMVFELKDRTAQFHTTLVVAAPKRDSLVVEADWEGYIAFSPKGDNGFGYDPLFLVGETGRSAAQLSAEEKNAQSHRGLAVKKLMEVFPKWQHNL
ncbi:nucleoside-triphosphate diphosphatase [Streptococcus sp. zg-JUN1979]|uniref:nucleoside-triphosphate diphosphatase n=1 Tax=Streptococcus sp. zg-JUN1979 TaxID=3391450 RepID=UPI0039A6105F